MSEELENIDNLFRDNLSNAQVTPPAGVWESIASASSTATTTAVVKTVWFASKWFLATLAVTAVTAVSVWVITHSGEDKKKMDGTSQIVSENKEASQNEVKAEENIAPSDVPKSKEESAQPNPFTPVAPKEYTKPASGKNPLVDDKGAVIKPIQVINPTIEIGPPDVIQQPVKAVASVKVNCPHTISIQTQKLSEKDYTFTAVNAKGVANWYFGDDGSAWGYEVAHSYTSENARKYNVKVVTREYNGCMDSARIEIAINPNNPIQRVFIPNYITPNGDGSNDEFWVDIASVVSFDLAIFDSRNVQVFRSSDANARWNGKCRSIDCPTGNYKVILSYKVSNVSEAIVYRGNLLLTR